VNWLGRLGRQRPPSEPEPDEAVPEATEAASPGVAALLEDVREDGSHAVLDLGAAAASSLGVYGRFARRVRFADLAGHAMSPEGRGSVTALLAGVPAQPDHPYDLVFAWDILDRLYPEFHAPLVARLAEVTAPHARLHVVARGSDQRIARPLRFRLVDIDRMCYEPMGPAREVRPRHLPAQLAHLLEPFHVVRGFTLKGDLREYVALRTPS
jgi:hypothetical protein